eukprot:scaffold3378_cov93-Isochrysis_galbana.AAC.3
MEGVTVKYDGTVRNSQGEVLQFLYGEDGMDAVRLENQKIAHVGLHIDKLRKMFEHRLDDPNYGRTGESPIGQPWMRAGLAEELKRDPVAKEELRLEFEQLLEDRRVLTDPRLGPFAKGKADPPSPVLYALPALSSHALPSHVCVVRAGRALMSRRGSPPGARALSVRPTPAPLPRARRLTWHPRCRAAGQHDAAHPKGAGPLPARREQAVGPPANGRGDQGAPPGPTSPQAAAARPPHRRRHYHPLHTTISARTATRLWSCGHPLRPRRRPLPHHPRRHPVPGARAVAQADGSKGRRPALGRGAVQRHLQLLLAPALAARLEARAQRAQAHPAGLRLAAWRDREPLSAAPGAAGGDGGCACRAVHRRARHPDDAQHLPLRRRLCQERDARRAAAEGDHQRVQATKDAVPHRLPQTRVRLRLGGGQGGPVAAGAHHAWLRHSAHRDLVRTAAPSAPLEP